jgi:methylase of polypeptide subunit release factors
MKITRRRFREDFHRLTHYLFRYPAKFHPPVAAFLVESFSNREDKILDPFCGSGTILVEGAIASRRVVGVDVDPVAAFVARVKSTPLTSARSRNELRSLLQQLPNAAAARTQEAWVPDIPNINHWFEPHVLCEVSTLRSQIDHFLHDAHARDIAECVFLSCIRGWSNADPVPVSGLEVTRHIKEKRKHGFFPDVRRQYTIALTKTLASIDDYSQRMKSKAFVPVVVNSDAESFLRRTRQTFDCLITSPPYLTAVDYYRRHTLEMFWHDPKMDQANRLKLKRLYLGQYQVSSSMTEQAESIELSRRTERLALKIEDRDEQRARAFRHYFSSMKGLFSAASYRVKKGGSIVVVIGDGRVVGDVVPTGRLLAEEFSAFAELTQVITYPLRNRYMTYKRRNQASIEKDRILVFRNK